MGFSFLSGKRVRLRPLAKKDAQGPYLQWFNDAETCSQNSHHVFPFCERDAEAYIEEARKNKNALILAVETIQPVAHIGNIALQNINHFAKNAEYAVMIGDKRCWGKGYAEEASLLILEHGFKALGLRRVYAGTFAENRGMRSLAKKLGMKEEGLRRKAYYKDGRFVDIVEFGLLKEDFLRYVRSHHV